MNIGEDLPLANDVPSSLGGQIFAAVTGGEGDFVMPMKSGGAMREELRGLKIRRTCLALRCTATLPLAVCFPAMGGLNHDPWLSLGRRLSCEA